MPQARRQSQPSPARPPTSLVNDAGRKHGLAGEPRCPARPDADRGRVGRGAGRPRRRPLRRSPRRLNANASCYPRRELAAQILDERGATDPARGVFRNRMLAARRQQLGGGAEVRSSRPARPAQFPPARLLAPAAIARLPNGAVNTSAFQASIWGWTSAPGRRLMSLRRPHAGGAASTVDTLGAVRDDVRELAEARCRPHGPRRPAARGDAAGLRHRALVDIADASRPISQGRG